jgi:hypothetical protein
MTGTLKASFIATVCLVSLVFASSEAAATPITFSTSGTFTCAGCSGSGTNSVTFFGDNANAFLLTFTGLGSTSLNTPTGTSFGNFQAFFSGTGDIAISGEFTLAITQILPTPGTDSFLAAFSGTFTASNSGSGVVTFTTTEVTIGGITYSITNSPLNLVPPSANNGIATVFGQVTDAATPVPEPSTMALMSLGLAGVCVLRSRRNVRRR